MNKGRKGLQLISFVFGSATLLQAGTITASDFCDGFEDGYKEGYCYSEPFCLAPLPPLCPMQNLGEEGYRDGYNRGFLEGLKKAGKSTSP